MELGFKITLFFIGEKILQDSKTVQIEVAQPLRPFKEERQMVCRVMLYYVWSREKLREKMGLACWKIGKNAKLTLNKK